MTQDLTSPLPLETRIDAFLGPASERPPFPGTYAVVGASTNRDKYGNKVLRAYQQNTAPVHPINPRADEIEGLPCHPDLATLHALEPIHGVSIITPPKITEQVVEDAIALGIKHLWMQPGAESDTAVKRATDAGLHVIAGDACVLVVLGYREH